MFLYFKVFGKMSTSSEQVTKYGTALVRQSSVSMRWAP